MNSAFENGGSPLLARAGVQLFGRKKTAVLSDIAQKQAKLWETLGQVGKDQAGVPLRLVR